MDRDCLNLVTVHLTFFKNVLFYACFPVPYPVSNLLLFSKVYKLNVQLNYKICSYFISNLCTFITVINKRFLSGALDLKNWVYVLFMCLNIL